MSADRYWGNPAFVAYERALIQLHRLTAHLSAETPEPTFCDHLYKTFVDLCLYLTPEEFLQLEGLRYDLGIRMDREILPPPPATTRPDIVVRHNRFKLSVLLKSELWQDALAILRNGPHEIPLADIAIMRAFIYKRLGHFAVSKIFTHAAQGAIVETYRRYGR